MSATEGVKLVTFVCPTCGARVRIVDSVVSAVCDANGKHRQVKMEKKK